MFVGTVTGENNDAYRFHVTEAFKGVTGDTFEVEAVPGMSFTGFETGKQYLVFAYTLTVEDGTKYHLARGCGLTREFEYAQAALEQIRAEKNGERVASVYGTLLRMAPETLAWDQIYERPLPGVIIRLQSGKKSYEAKTDEHGAYAFSRLPPGTYQASADLPLNLTLGDGISDRPPSAFELPRNSSFDYDLDALPTGRIRGYVEGPDGKPLAITSVELYRADLFALDRRGLFASQVEGKPFEFFHLPPGDYVLVFNRQNFTSPDAPFHRTFLSRRGRRSKRHANSFVRRPADFRCGYSREGPRSDPEDHRAVALERPDTLRLLSTASDRRGQRMARSLPV